MRPQAAQELAYTDRADQTELAAEQSVLKTSWDLGEDGDHESQGRGRGILRQGRRPQGQGHRRREGTYVLNSRFLSLASLVSDRSWPAKLQVEKATTGDPMKKREAEERMEDRKLEAESDERVEKEGHADEKSGKHTFTTATG